MAPIDPIETHGNQNDGNNGTNDEASSRHSSSELFFMNEALIAKIYLYLEEGSELPLVVTNRHAYKAFQQLNRPLQSTIEHYLVSVELLRWAIGFGCPTNFEEISFLAAGAGQLQILHWACTQTTQQILSADLASVAAENAQLHILQYLLMAGCPMDDRVCASASTNDDVEMLVWARSQAPPLPWNSSCCSNAAYEGNIATLQWLRSQMPPCPWDSLTAASAAQGGQKLTLQWLRSQNPPCPWDAFTTAILGETGDLELLKWVRSQNPPCPWDSVLCSNAAKNGHVHILQWARAQNPPCPWDVSTCSMAASNGHLKIVEWCRAQSPACPIDPMTFYEYATRNKHTHMLNWAKTNNIGVPSAPSSACVIEEEDEDDLTGGEAEGTDDTLVMDMLEQPNIYSVNLLLQ